MKSLSLFFSSHHSVVKLVGGDIALFARSPSLSLVVPYLNHFKRPRGSLLSESIIELPPLEKRPTLGGINLKQSGPLQDYTQTWCIVTLQALAHTYTHMHAPSISELAAKQKSRHSDLWCAQCGIIHCWNPERKKWERVCWCGKLFVWLEKDFNKKLSQYFLLLLKEPITS